MTKNGGAGDPDLIGCRTLALIAAATAALTATLAYLALTCWWRRTPRSTP